MPDDELDSVEETEEVQETETTDPAALRAQIQAELEADMQRHKAALSRKTNAMAETLRSVGLAAGEDGQLYVQDPNAFRQTAAAYFDDAKSTSEPKPDDDEIDLYADDAATVSRKVAKKVEAGVNKATADLRRQVEELSGAVRSNLSSRTLQIARDALSKFGDIGAVVETPEFQSELRAAMSGLSPAQLDNEELIQMAAAQSFVRTPSEAIAKAKAAAAISAQETPATPRRNEGSRQALRSSGVTSGNAPSSRATTSSAEIPSSRQAFWDLMVENGIAGMRPGAEEEFLAISAPVDPKLDPDSAWTAYRYYEKEKQKANSR